jgi:hypothetical protein
MYVIFEENKEILDSETLYKSAFDLFILILTFSISVSIYELLAHQIRTFSV